MIRPSMWTVFASALLIVACGDGVTETSDGGGVATVELDVENTTIEEGVERQLTATARDAAGHPILGRGMQWTSSDPGIVMVGALGRITALRPGAATVHVTVDGKLDSARVIVHAEYEYDLIYDGWNNVPGEHAQLYRLDVRHPGSGSARIIPGVASYDGSPSPDGTRIVFAAYVNGKWQLFIANAYGGGVRRLTTSTMDDDQPVWNAAGTKIAFRRWDMTPGTGHSDIMVIDADGTGLVNLTADQGRTNQTTPAWSIDLADGTSRIAYSSQTNDARGEAHLWSMRADGGDKQQLTSGEVFDVHPAWSPDAATLVYERYMVGLSGDLYTVSAGGGTVKRLTTVDLALGQFAPAWSPDGKLIAFASKHEGGTAYQIYTVWADGSKLTRRTFDETSKQNPAWIIRAEPE